MANPRQRRKQKSGTKAVRRRSRNSSLRPNLNISDPLIKAAWDPSKTVKQNFSALGLAEDVNRTIGSSAMRKKMMAWQQEKTAAVEEIERVRGEAKKRAEEAGVLDMTPVDFGEEAIFGSLNDIFQSVSADSEEATKEAKLIDFIEQESKQAPVKEKKGRPLSADERELIGKLCAKHGSDFVAMAKDLKMNVMQLTPKQLESLYLRK